MKNAVKIIGLFVLLITLGLSSIYVLPNDWHDADCQFETNDSTFSIMTFNLDAGDSLHFLSDKQHRLIALIEKEKPSILCLQELSFENHDKLKPFLEKTYGRCETLSYADAKWRFLFYSRFTMRNFERLNCDEDMNTAGFDDKLISEYEMRKKQMPIMSAEFEVTRGRWIRLFAGHLRSNAYSTARRSMDGDASWVEGIPQYYRNYRNGKRIRDYEARCIRGYIGQAMNDGLPVIVAGDLNDWCGSDCLDMLMCGKGSSPELKDAWKTCGRGWGFTYFGWSLKLTLDHILYSKDFELLDVKVIDTDISDHRPLMGLFRQK